MKECKICYEIKLEKFLPCSHSVCHECYDKLQGNNCPYCRQPFRNNSSNDFFNNNNNDFTINPYDNNDPDYWMDYQRNGWVVYSRYLRSGNEIIRVFRQNNVPASWRNDDLTTVVKRRRLRRLRRI